MLKSQTILQLFLQSANVVCDYSLFIYFFFLIDVEWLFLGSVA